MTEEIINILYASDDGFAEILGVSMVSLYENNKNENDIVIYIFDSGISEENKKNLKLVSHQYNRHEPVFITAKNIDEVLSLKVNQDRGSLSQYARLFLTECLPNNISRILYLDCDIIINKSLHELWNMDLNGCIIAALRDAFSAQYRKNIELKPDDVMFNSGVMLVDLDKWKENDVEKKLMDFIRRKNGNIQQGDQGALNAILSKNTFCFHPRFNSVTIFYDFSYEEMLKYRKPVNPYTPEEVREAVENPVIIHFTTSFLSERPWFGECKHFYAQKWIMYKKKSPWKNSPQWKKKKSKGLKGIYLKICSVLPRKIVIAISGFLQVYGRPLYYSLKK